MKNVRAISCILIILGAVLVEVSYRLLGEGGDQFWPHTFQTLLPALTGFIFINQGAKGLVRPPV